MKRRAIVTGCSRGIGRAVTEMLLGEGWKVWGISRTAPGLKHVNFIWQRGDMTCREDTMVLQRFRSHFDALIHCAGIRGPYGSFLDTDADEWERTITTNLLGTARIVRAALPALQRSEDGRILLFSGGGAFSPESGYTAYAASKGATVSFMETLAAELAGTNVTVNCVAPGFVPTDIHKGTPHEAKQSTGEEMGQAVACVRHLLGPQAKGLHGKSVSAVWDDWQNLHPWNVERVNASEGGTRTRHSIAMLQHLSMVG